MILVEKRIEINGLSFNYVEGGNGAPMIFMHNGGGFWQSWQKQLGYFSATNTVYGLDWPGFGESEAPQGLISLQLLAATLKEFIEQKKLQDIILIGNCIGGSAALHYANEYPDKIKKLIIFNICPGDLIFPVPFIRPLIRQMNKRKGLKKNAGKILKYAFTKTPVRHRFPAILFAKQFDREDQLFKKYIAKNRTPAQNASRTNLVFSVHTFRLDAYVGKKKIFPHVLIWGEENNVVSLKRHGLYCESVLHPIKFITIPKGGHLCMYEKAALTNKIILDNI